MCAVAGADSAATDHHVRTYSTHQHPQLIRVLQDDLVCYTQNTCNACLRKYREDKDYHHRLRPDHSTISSPP